MMPVLELQSVQYTRKDTRILDGITWRVEHGDHWIVFGPNSSGKTTLLRIITGYLWPSEGSVSVLGERFGDVDLSELRKCIGWVSRSIEYLVHDEDPAVEIVMAGHYAGTVLWREVDERVEARARALLSSFGFDAATSKPYGVLSQGEQKKVLIARALMNHPALLVLDEPCEGLDVASKNRVLDDLARIANEPYAPCIIMVTHAVDEIMPFFTKILALKSGRVLAQGGIDGMLTTSLLERLFDMSIRVEKRGKRYIAVPG